MRRLQSNLFYLEKKIKFFCFITIYLKGFYKRTVLQKKLYKCIYNNNCAINILERRKCKACRFKKCLDLGMSIEGMNLAGLINSI